MASKIALMFGMIFVLIGLIGIVGGLGVMGASGFFVTDPLLDLIHLLSGIIFILAAARAPRKSAAISTILGILYLLAAILGFVGGDNVAGVTSVNGADNYLHLVLALVMIIVGLSLRERARLM